MLADCGRVPSVRPVHASPGPIGNQTFRRSSIAPYGPGSSVRCLRHGHRQLRDLEGRSNDGILDKCQRGGHTDFVLYQPNLARMASCLMIISLVMYASLRIWSRKSPDMSGMPQRTNIITMATKFCRKKRKQTNLFVKMKQASGYSNVLFLPRI